MRSKITLLFVLLSISGLAHCKSETALQVESYSAALLLLSVRAYRVDFEATWSAATHGTGLGIPANPHFSRLIGATHTAGYSHWSQGTIATNGMEAMAERGATTTLADEFRTAGSVESFTGAGVDSPGSVSVTFLADESRTNVTLVTMLAPSPDWFVGVSNFPLKENGAWIDRKVASLITYDAGTDSGATFTAADIDTVPKVAIQPLAVDPFFVGGNFIPVGTFTFTRVN